MKAFTRSMHMTNLKPFKRLSHKSYANRINAHSNKTMKFVYLKTLFLHS